MPARHHSLPPASHRRPSSSHSLTSSTTTAAAPTTLLTRHATAYGSTGTNASRLVAQADALARMTLELNLHAVSSQANRMEKQLRKLVLATADDAEFRRQNEARMSAMWREIVAVRQRAGEQKDIAFLDAETCRRETEKVVRGIKEEVGELKELVAGISNLVDGLPSAEEVKRLVGEEQKTVVEQQQVCSPAKTQPLKSQPPRTPAPKTPPTTTPTSRIREAINSTRRWNRDHKTTSLSDAVFCANYLRQQSKRDPAVAVFIQKAVQRRVRAKDATPFGQAKPPKPKSLDEFCQRVTWADVRAAVEDTLVRDTTDVMRLLR